MSAPWIPLFRSYIIFGRTFDVNKGCLHQTQVQITERAYNGVRAMMGIGGGIILIHPFTVDDPSSMHIIQFSESARSYSTNFPVTILRSHLLMSCSPELAVSSGTGLDNGGWWSGKENESIKVSERWPVFIGHPPTQRLLKERLDHLLSLVCLLVIHDREFEVYFEKVWMEYNKENVVVRKRLNPLIQKNDFKLQGRNIGSAKFLFLMQILTIWCGSLDFHMVKQMMQIVETT